MPILKPLRWIGSTRDVLRGFPDEVRRNIGFALQFAQTGTKHPSAKPLHGLGTGVLEIVDDHAGDAYRAVYTVRFRKAVYVLHAFMKKSKTGRSTPRHEIELIRERLRRTADDYAEIAPSLPET